MGAQEMGDQEGIKTAEAYVKTLPLVRKWLHRATPFDREDFLDNQYVKTLPPVRKWLHRATPFDREDT